MYAPVHTILSISVGGAIVLYSRWLTVWRVKIGWMYGKPETGQKYSITHRGYQNNGEIIFALSRRLMNFIENVRSSSAMLR